MEFIHLLNFENFEGGLGLRVCVCVYIYIYIYISNGGINIFLSPLLFLSPSFFNRENSTQTSFETDKLKRGSNINIWSFIG
jgi:hypothetical protein